MFDGSLVQDTDAGGWWHFRDARRTLVASRLEDVLPMLREAEERVERDGLWAAGFIAYEAAPAFDPAFRVREPVALPLLWLGLFPPPRLVARPLRGSQAPARYGWVPSVDRASYDRAITRIRELIAAGDTYQVNYTLRLRARVEEDPRELFLRMVAANEPRYGAYLDCGTFAVCSASPELFLRLDGNTLITRPMKGTTARGRWAADDRARAEALAASAKDRAENVMIVDMARNDLGRVAATGSVRVPGLFEVERYPTLWQMTSTVQAETVEPLSEILRATFPPASITGAPKARTTEIIAELETAPRGVYTGCIGFIAPGRRAQFNVAIRTAVVDRSHSVVEYGVGGGIVWDSRSNTEYEEALLKASIVTQEEAEFALLETMLWEPVGGYWLLDEHLHRLLGSADYFGFPRDESLLRRKLATLADELSDKPQRVRLLLFREGEITLESKSLDEPSALRPVRLGIAPAPIDAADRFLYHKTTRRQIYEQAKAARPDCDDVVLWNESREITETTVANIVAELDGERLTPALACGLLPGTFRARLIARGEVREARITLEQLRSAQRIHVVSSVRKWRAATLV